MKLKYSEIREKFGIKPEKAKDEGQAAFTHFLQNMHTDAADIYRKAALEYMHKTSEDENLIRLIADQKISVDWSELPVQPVKNPTFTFIDLFAGIGGFRLAFQKNGGKCVFTSEIDKFAKTTYEANYGKVPFGDIQPINENEIPDHDILAAGFPCQPFSLAGVSKKTSLGRKHGFQDETQGTLFFDIVRILKAKRPKAFLLENVKNLVSHDKGKTFKVIQGALDELDYSVHFDVLDGKYFTPQHRERIIIVGFDKRRYEGIDKTEFEQLDGSFKSDLIKEFKKNMLEQREVVTVENSGLLEDRDVSAYTLSDKLWQYLQDYAAKHRAKGNGFGFGLIDKSSVTRTLSARYHKDGSEILIPQKNENGEEINPRRLTERECARLQGFPDYFKIDAVSRTQAYRQFGNSVVTTLMEDVAEIIVEKLKEFDERRITEGDTVSI